MDKMQNLFCQQTLELDQTIAIGQTTSEAINKEKFVPRGAVCSIAREELRKQCNRDFSRMKTYIEKKLKSCDDNKKKDNNKPKKIQKKQSKRQKKQSPT